MQTEKKHIKDINGDSDITLDRIQSNSLITFRNNGNVTIGDIDKNVTLIFRNIGNVYLDIKKDCRTANFIFKNKGNVILTHIAYLYGQYEFKNAGMVRIKCAKTARYKCVFKNIGDVYTIFPIISKNIEISNHGDFSSKEAIRIENGMQFNNYSSVTLIKCNLVGDNTVFNNGGNVLLGSNKTTLRRNVVFNNGGNVTLKNARSVAMNSIFRNGGDLTITGLKKLNRERGIITIENNGDVTFKDLQVLKRFRTDFNNKGNVYLKNLITLTTDTKFNNNGHVYLNRVRDIHRAHFINGGNVYVNNINYINRDTKYANGGNLYIKKLKTEYKKSRVCVGGYVYTKKGISIEHISYTKRYNLKLDDGYMLLYKAVDENYISPYDSDKLKWDLYKTNTVSYWDPYKEEIDAGKFLATPVPYWCDSLMENKKCKYVAVAIHINDVFEWKGVPKFPKFIGFRTGTVLYECDRLGNKIQ